MSLPSNPITRQERYLSKIAGEETSIPDYPITREEQYLDYIARHGGGGGGSVTVDDEMSSTSTNPVQNKVITAALGDKADLVSGKVPAAQLPSYVDDVIEGYYYNEAFYEDAQHTTLITGESGKIYVDLATNKSYRWSGSAYIEIAGGGSAELTSALSVAVDVGGIDAGASYAAGTPLETILSDMLSPTLYPTIVEPTVRITSSQTLFEKGTNTYQVVSMTVSRGSITPAYGTNGYRAGTPSASTIADAAWWVYDSNFEEWMEYPSSHNNGFKVSASTAKWYVVVYFADGEQPKDSKGNNYGQPYSNSNGEESNTITYTFVNAMWANTANIATVAKLSLVNNSTTKQRDMVFPAQTVANPEVFDIPASWTVTAVQVKNDLSGQYEDASSQFTVTDTTHNDAGGTSTAYKRYTFNMGMATGARTVRVKWS